MHKKIRISPRDMKEIKRLFADGKKIAAIKHARSKGKIIPPREETLPSGEFGINHRPDLRSAKHAVEELAGVIPTRDASATFVTTLQIKKVIVEGETGNIELDLEGLQLRCLDGLSQGIPISEVGAMTELITFIRKWQGDEDEK